MKSGQVSGTGRAGAGKSEALDERTAKALVEAALGAENAFRNATPQRQLQIVKACASNPKLSVEVRQRYRGVSERMEKGEALATEVLSFSRRSGQGSFLKTVERVLGIHGRAGSYSKVMEKAHAASSQAKRGVSYESFIQAHFQALEEERREAALADARKAQQLMKDAAAQAVSKGVVSIQYTQAPNVPPPDAPNALAAEFDTLGNLKARLQELSQGVGAHADLEKAREAVDRVSQGFAVRSKKGVEG